jgi:hypothetical protein
MNGIKIFFLPLDSFYLIFFFSFRSYYKKGIFLSVYFLN